MTVVGLSWALVDVCQEKNVELKILRFDQGGPKFEEQFEIIHVNWKDRFKAVTLSYKQILSYVNVGEQSSVTLRREKKNIYFQMFRKTSSRTPGGLDIGWYRETICICKQETASFTQGQVS